MRVCVGETCGVGSAWFVCFRDAVLLRVCGCVTGYHGAAYVSSQHNFSSPDIYSTPSCHMNI